MFSSLLLSPLTWSHIPTITLIILFDEKRGPSFAAADPASEHLQLEEEEAGIYNGCSRYLAAVIESLL